MIDLLIVDDDLELRETMVKFFVRQNYAVQSAGS
jgi:DNA-binding response OmpR family regulator